jgi:hypothetical protein
LYGLWHIAAQAVPVQQLHFFHHMDELNIFPNSVGLPDACTWQSMPRSVADMLNPHQVQATAASLRSLPAQQHQQVLAWQLRHRTPSSCKRSQQRPPA